MVVSGGVGHRCGLDLALLWLWCRPEAVALIRSLDCHTPYDMCVAIKGKERRKERKRERESERERKKERKTER